MRNKYKKVAALLCVLVMTSASYSCSSNKKEKESTKSVIETVNLPLKSANIEMAKNFSKIVSIDRDISSGEILIFGELNSGGWSGYTTDSSFSDYEEFTFIPEDGETVMNAALMSYGKKAVLTDNGGIAKIYVFGSDNKEEKVFECPDIQLKTDMGALLYVTESGFYINNANLEVYALDSTGKYLGKVDDEGKTIHSVTKNKDGSLMMLLGDMEKTWTAQIDATSITNKQECTYMNSSAYAIGSGTGDYSCVAIFNNALYGLRDSDWVKLNDFSEIALEAYSVYDIFMSGENEFVALSSGGEQVNLNMLSENTSADLQSKEVIKIATWMESDAVLASAIKDFNLSHDDVRVEMVSYAVAGETIEVAIENMKLDMVSGNCPDIMQFNGLMPVNSFGSKEDMFVDLYTMIDKDDDFSRDDFVPQFIEEFESENGKLLSLCAGVEFETVYAKAGINGVKESWAVDDVIETYNSLPDGMEMFKSDKLNPRTLNFTNFVPICSLVDYESATCSFDSTEFIKLIEFFNENNIGLTPDEYFSQAGNLGDENFCGLDIRNNKVCVSIPYSYHINQIVDVVHGEFDNDAVVVGFPTVEGNGCILSKTEHELGIMANSPNADLAWEFIKYYLYEWEWNDEGISILKDEFDKAVTSSMYDWEYTDPYTGEVTVYEREYLYDVSNGDSIPVENFSQEEMEYFRDLILSATFVEYDGNIFDICYDELSVCFNGERSAEETAKLIQNRVSIYLSEHYE